MDVTLNPRSDLSTLRIMKRVAQLPIPCRILYAECQERLSLEYIIFAFYLNANNGEQSTFYVEKYLMFKLSKKDHDI